MGDLPVVARDMPRHSFPFTLQLVDTLTGELLWEQFVEGPTALRIPGFAPRKVSALVIDSDGHITRMDPQ